MPLEKSAFFGLGRLVGKGVLAAGKGLLKGTAKATGSMALGTVKNVAGAANTAGKFIAKSPKRALGAVATGMTAKETIGKHLGQTWNMNQYAPIRFN